MKKVLMGCAVAVLAAVVSSCSEPKTGCTSNSECGDGQECTNSECVSASGGGSGSTGGGSATAGGGTATAGGGSATTGGGSAATGGGSGSTGGGTTGGGTATTGGGTGSTGGGSQACTPGTECRASVGTCDIAEMCDGTGNCPADTFVAPGTVCRAPAGPCDLDERCTGNSGVCPDDTLSPNTTVCRSSEGGCDPEEKCTGSSVNCPTNTIASNGDICRPLAGDCDVAETCDGTSVNCPADTFMPNTTICRGVADVCDLQEACTGTGAVCPPDMVKSNGTVCRGAAGACDIPETCNGTSVMCPGDAVQPSTVICAPRSCAMGTVQPENYCPGNGVTCNNDPPVSCNGYTCNGTNCRTTCASNGDCITSTHFCDASGHCATKRIDGDVCSGATSGFECASGSCTQLWADADNDEYGTGTPTYRCGTGALANYAANGTDCCDSDNRAHPGQTAFYTTPRTTCGGYDYDCSGTEVKQYTAVNACKTSGTCGGQSCSGTVGWSATTSPACGAAATYVTTCNSHFLTAGSCAGDELCDPVSSSRTQGCH